MAMVATRATALALCALAGAADARLTAVPESLRGTPFGDELALSIRSRGRQQELLPRAHVRAGDGGRGRGAHPPPPKPVETRYLSVPLDHTKPKDIRRHRIRYWVVNSSWDGPSRAKTAPRSLRPALLMPVGQYRGTLSLR